MEQSLAKFNPAALAAIIGQDNLAAVNDPFAGGISSGDYLPQISIRGNRFRLKMNGDETVLKENTLEVFLVTSRPNVSKTFYENGYDPSAEAKGPDCSSADGQHPDSNIENPVNSNCQTCPNNAWGSKITGSGKKGKACSDYKLVVLALAAAPDKPFALRIPAASLKPFAAYIQKLNLAGVPANAAKTLLSLGDEEYPTLVFDFGGTVDTKEQYEAIMALSESADVLNAVRITPRAETATHAAQQPVVVPAPVQENATTEIKAPEPEPTPEPAKEPSLSDLLGSKPKTTRKKKAEEPAPAVEEAPAPEPAPAAEDGGEITSLDQLLGKLKNK